MKEVLVRADGATDPGEPQAENADACGLPEWKVGSPQTKKGDRENYDQNSGPEGAEYREVPRRVVAIGVCRDEERDADSSSDAEDARCGDQASRPTAAVLGVLPDRSEDAGLHAVSQMSRSTVANLVHADTREDRWSSSASPCDELV